MSSISSPVGQYGENPYWRLLSSPSFSGRTKIARDCSFKYFRNSCGKNRILVDRIRRITSFKKRKNHSLFPKKS